MPEGSSASPAKSNRTANPPALPRAPRIKPAKPYPDFPLFPHATGRWAKKIRGRFAFFGPWSDPHGALERFLEQRDALMAGRVHRPAANAAPAGRADAGLVLRDLANHFLTAKQRDVDRGELGRRSFADYHTLAKRLVGFFGPHRLVSDLTPDDFGSFRQKLAATRGPLALGADITKTRTLFKHGYEGGLLPQPVRYGPQFDKPTRKTVRIARARRGVHMFEPGEIHALIDAASVQMRAMILLGINCGTGNTDLASLPRSAIDLKLAVLSYPRPKTGVERRAPLWPQTVAALKAVTPVRPEPKLPQDRGLCFVTKYGARWVRVQAPSGKRPGQRTIVAIDGISLEFGKLMRETGTHAKGRGFYALRHTFRTVADEVRDRPAVDLIMGHENGRDVATHYVERISDERLRAVTEHVRVWLGVTIKPPLRN